jgi:DNA invertase Pin-like site-specific DNA recombinase
MAAFAEHEREQISQRTKAALRAAQTRGARLGKDIPVAQESAMAQARQCPDTLGVLCPQYH